MNKLDMSLQNASWKVETQSIKVSAQNMDSGEGGQQADTFAVFDNLLRRMSEKGDVEPAKVQLPIVEGKPALSLGGKPEVDRADEDWSADLLQEPRRDTDGLQKSSLALSSAVISIDVVSSSQPLLPQVFATANPGIPAPQDKPSASASSSLLDLIQLSTDRSKEGQSPEGLSLSAGRKTTVVHQETHFKPIPAEAPMVTRQKNDRILTSPTVEPAKFDDGPMAPSDAAQEETVRQNLPASQLSRDAHHRTAASSDKDPVSSPDPHGILQKVVSAIESDAKRLSLESGAPVRHHETSTPMMTKQSDGVLRMLDIQLRPAELGVITVKMRLSGDKLEMELHASREETAELLKKDSELLSSLLRTSGYRPDAVSIHTGRLDAAQPDGLFGQRQSANHDAAGQFGSPQGGEAGQNGRSRGDAEELRNSSQGGQKNGAEEIDPANRSSGSLYL